MKICEKNNAASSDARWQESTCLEDKVSCLFVGCRKYGPPPRCERVEEATRSPLSRLPTPSSDPICFFLVALRSSPATPTFPTGYDNLKLNFLPGTGSRNVEIVRVSLAPFSRVSWRGRRASFVEIYVHPSPTGLCSNGVLGQPLQRYKRLGGLQNSN